MTPRLQRSFVKLNEQTQRLFAELQSWSPNRLRFRAQSESWSTLDLIDHLRLSERAVLTAMQRNLHVGNRVTFHDRCRNTFVLGIMLLPTRLKVPGSVIYIMPSGTQDDLSALRSEWAEDRKMLAAFLDSLSVTQQKQGVFRHPVGGWATPNGALLFLRSHLHHHLYQFARIRKASKRVHG